MEVHFYLPERYLPDSDRQEAWRSGKITRLEEGGKIACAQCWIYQTWLALERSGFPVRLTHSIPSDGTLVTLTNCVHADFQPSDGLIFIGIVADYSAHPHAHLHIVQNAAHGKRLWNAAFMPLWPHPNLIPRDPARSDRFENVCFFGELSNLARELTDSAMATEAQGRVERRVCDLWRRSVARLQRCRLCSCRARLRTLQILSQAGDKTLQCLAGWSSFHRREGFGLRGGRGARTELSAGVNP